MHGEFKRVDPNQLRAAVLPFAKPGFFAVRLEGAQDAVEKLPWVERAEVRKRWPDVLEVEVVEHQPFARWGNDRLLSEHGRLFPVPKDMSAEALPLLDGPDSQVAEVVALYNESRELFAPVGFKVDSLVMDRRGSWSLALSNGTAGGGRPHRRAPAPGPLRAAAAATAGAQRTAAAARRPALHQWFRIELGERPRASGRRQGVCCGRRAPGHGWPGRTGRSRHGHAMDGDEDPRESDASFATGEYMNRKGDKSLIVGLDIGTSKVTALVGEYSPGNPIEVIGIGSHESRGLKRGVVVDIESTVQSIQRAVEEAELMAGCEIRSVYASISGAHVQCKNSPGIVPIRDDHMQAIT